MMTKFQSKSVLFPFVIALLAFAVYANSFQNSFQYDDFHSIVRNPAIKNIENISRVFLDPKTGSGLIPETSSYRPVLLVSFAINYFFGGLNVFGYHLLNLLLHVLCSIILYYIIFLILRFDGCELQNPARNRLIALFAGLIFALHPAQVESVTYISGRSSSLLAFFFLGSFWAYLKYYETRSNFFLFISPISFAAALLVKETAITLPAILILFTFFFLGQYTWKRKIFSFFPHVFVAAFYLALRIHFFGFLQPGSQPIRPLYENLLTQTRAWVHYIWTLLLPVNLTIYYDLPSSHSMMEAKVLLATALLVSVGVAVWRISKTLRPVGFFALWIVVILLPTNSLIALEDVVTDRWMYLSLAGYAGILALLAGWMFTTRMAASRHGKIICFFICVLILDFYGFATAVRNFTWRTDFTLWQDAVLKSPQKEKPHVAYALALSGMGRIEEAIQEFHKAIRINPGSGEAYINLGSMYDRQGRWEEAIRAFQTAVRLRPHLAPEVHYNLGIILDRQGYTEDAIKEFQQALRARPNFEGPYHDLGLIHERNGNLDEAISSVEKSVKIQPEYLRARHSLIRLYEKKGWEEKRREAQKNFDHYNSPKEWFVLGH